jgi:hypothetical protein
VRIRAMNGSWSTSEKVIATPWAVRRVNLGSVAPERAAVFPEGLVMDESDLGCDALQAATNTQAAANRARRVTRSECPFGARSSSYADRRRGADGHPLRERM